MNTSPEQLSQIPSSSFLSQLDFINDEDPIAQKLVDKWYTPIKKPRWYLAEKSHSYYLFDQNLELMKENWNEITDWFNTAEALWDDCILLKKRDNGLVAQFYLPTLQKFASFDGLEAVDGNAGHFKAYLDLDLPGTAIIQFMYGSGEEVKYRLNIASWVTTRIKKTPSKELPTNVLTTKKVFNKTLRPSKNFPDAYEMVDVNSKILFPKIYAAEALTTVRGEESIVKKYISITVSSDPLRKKLCDNNGKLLSKDEYISIENNNNVIDCITITNKADHF